MMSQWTSGVWAIKNENGKIIPHPFLLEEISHFLKTLEGYYPSTNIKLHAAAVKRILEL